MLKYLLPLVLTTAVIADDVNISEISEAFGHLIGRNLENPGFTLEVDSIIKGMRAAADGEPAPMTDAEYEQALGQLQQQEFGRLSDQNLEDAEMFLEENQDHAGIVVLEEGKLQMRVEKEGEGREVLADTKPLVHYTGRYMDGTVFGTSTDGEPVNLPLGQTIPGFSLGVVGMKEGEKRTLFVHPDLGYGTTGHLPPNSLLVFEVEVLETQVPVAASAEPEQLWMHHEDHDEANSHSTIGEE